MRKTKKIMSLALASAMVASLAMVKDAAAESTEAAVTANIQSVCLYL